ncbi:UPF0449 protein C19orf25 homolog [Homalodisca vitripennis]|uniref:UPF0449 protein C19orf25 homolog n=1 Tax=Homalodisca vitripennis TaxID=197043 RepID=UPI001EEB33E8|nr:UPF0449 protein C19orf25 homolog [Homalodisca vitripennis]XP_046676670.1 UPF0449 protein C19orf25 homolog [Homalodisca vitripennis]KAG8247303.1 hypothetical protein J6590_063573 [Homalodisca vitripennis]
MKMFKKKSDLSLPPLPKPPKTEQMIEDINSADDNDPVFLEGSCKRMFDERTKTDEKFEIVKECIGANQDLNGLIIKTGEKLTRLQNSRDELQEMTESIKNKVAGALD